MLPADSVNKRVVTHVPDPTDPSSTVVTETYTLPPVTPGGDPGSMVIVDGVQTSYTPPT